MILTLLFEIILTCLLAVGVGFALDRWRDAVGLPRDRVPGALSLPLVTAGINITFLVLVVILLVLTHGLRETLYYDRLPLDQLNVIEGNRLPPGYLGNAFLVLEISIWTFLLAGAAGYFFDRWISALALELGAAAVALLCFIFAMLPAVIEALPADLSLLVGIVVVGLVGSLVFSAWVLRNKGSGVLRFLWFGYCLACWSSYQAAGRIGLLFITPLVLVALWGALFYFSQQVLPIQNGQGLLAFRSLLTFTLGTNYPYYVIEDWRNQQTCEKDKIPPRVPGDPFGQFFAGPGIVLNDCNHVAVFTNGTKFTVHPPGLSFTDLFDQLYADVDLRPQLRVTTVPAETKDGIIVKTLFFMPHKVGTGGRQPALGESYPFDENDVLKAVCQQAVIEHKWQRDPQTQAATENVRKIPYDELVLMMGPPIFKEIIVKYTCNQLHAPGDPRVEIAAEFRKRMKDTMATLGIEMIGGGISNIVPPDDVIEQRIKNWEAEWKRRIEVELGEMEAETTRLLEPVPLEAQLEVMNEIADILRRADGYSDDALALQLVDALSEPDEQITSEEGLIKMLLARRRR